MADIVVRKKQLQETKVVTNVTAIKISWRKIFRTIFLCVINRCVLHKILLKFNVG